MSRNRALAGWIPDETTASPGQNIEVTTHDLATGQLLTQFTFGSGGGGGGGVHVSNNPPAVFGPGTMWLDVSNTSAPELKIFNTLGAWSLMGTTEHLPNPVSQGQVAQVDGALNWVADDKVDAGRF